MTIQPLWLRQVLVMTLAAALPISTTGCYTYHVYQIGGAEGREQGNQPSTEWKHKTLHAFAWGLVRQDLPIDACRAQSANAKGGIDELKVETNYVYALASVFTLGIWVPLKVSYRCAKPASPSGTLDRGRR